MTRYLSDQNKVVLFQESGTYAGSATPNPRWVGEVQDSSIDDNEGKLEDRYLGNLSRSYADFQDGPLDVTGTLTYKAQDMMLFAHAVGSVYETNTAGTNKVIVSEVNSDKIQNPFVSGTSNSTSVPFSFSLEDSKQSPGTGKNFIRTVRGAVSNTHTLSIAQGEKVSVDVGYTAQSIDGRSGTSTTISAPSVKPYLWNSATLTMFGTSFDTAKDISLEVNNNVEGPHYINGSRVIGAPYQGNRDYTLSLTSDLDSETSIAVYNQYYKGGSTFNATLDMNQDSTTGSQHTEIIMSGCEITSFEAPSTVEGVNELTLEIRPKNVSAEIYDDATKIGSYNPF